MKPAPLPALVFLDRLIGDTPEEKLPALVVALLAKGGELAGRFLATSPSSSEGAQRADENLNIEEASRRLGVSRDWLYRNARRLPFTIRIGRRLLFSARGLELWNRKRQGLNRS